jgi:hypothetical protein
VWAIAKDGAGYHLDLPADDPLRQFALDATALAMEQIAVLVARERDYGPENISRGGDGGLMLRINDKFERAWHLHVSGAEPAGESVDDTDVDLANYALIRRMGRHGKWPTPFRKIVLREESVLCSACGQPVTLHGNWYRCAACGVEYHVDSYRPGPGGRLYMLPPEECIRNHQARRETPNDPHNWFPGAIRR